MARNGRRPNTIMVKAFRYHESGVIQLGVYGAWQDKHIGLYYVGIDLFFWGFQLYLLLHGKPVYHCGGCGSEEEDAESWVLSGQGGQALLLCPKCQ